jgi:hypothetical protein
MGEIYRGAALPCRKSLDIADQIVDGLSALVIVEEVVLRRSR